MAKPLTEEDLQGMNFSQLLTKLLELHRGSIGRTDPNEKIISDYIIGKVNNLESAKKQLTEIELCKETHPEITTLVEKYGTAKALEAAGEHTSIGSPTLKLTIFELLNRNYALPTTSNAGSSGPC